jgi:battenin
VGDFWHVNAYVLLSFSYQLGVFVSRSSFYFFKFTKVWILTYFQVVNFIVFFTIAYWKWIEIYYQIPIMIFVGLMGGCSYVNCMYMILENKQLSKSQKELAVNVCSFFVDIGIVSAAFFALFISNVVITNNS